MCLQNLNFGNISSVPQILLAGVSIALLSGPLAAEDAVSEECAKILSEPPFSNIVELTQAGKFTRMTATKPEHSGSQILGVKCTPEQIKGFMEAGGWTFSRASEDLLRSVTPGSVGEIEFDYALFFCLKDETLWRILYGDRCVGASRIYWLNGHITSFAFQTTK